MSLQRPESSGPRHAGEEHGIWLPAWLKLRRSSIPTEGQHRVAKSFVPVRDPRAAGPPRDGGLAAVRHGRLVDPVLAEAIICRE